MAKSYDAKKIKGEVKEIKKNIEMQKGEVGKLEEQKQALVEAMMEVEGSNIDVDAKQVIHEAVNAAIEKNREKGKEISNNLGQEIKTLESNKQESQESMSDAKNEKKKLEQRKKLLDRFGIGGTLDSGISKLEANIQEIEGINEEIIQAMQELSQVSGKAGNIWRNWEGIHVSIPDQVVDTWTIEELLKDREVRVEAWNTLLEAVQSINDTNNIDELKNNLENYQKAEDNITAVSNVIVLSFALLIEIVKRWKKGGT